MSNPSPTRTSTPPIRLETSAPSLPPPRLGLVVGAGAAVLALLLYTFQQHGADRALLLALGLALGVTLFHARFGFASAWRQLVSVGQGRGLQAPPL